MAILPKFSKYENEILKNVFNRFTKMPFGPRVIHYILLFTILTSNDIFFKYLN